MQYWYKAEAENSFCSKWELLKFEVGQYLRAYSSNLAKARRSEEEKVFSGILALLQKNLANMSDEDKLELNTEQLKLNEIYLNKAKGAFVRSCKRWIEEGGQK